jgi:hypothetical protein
MVGFPFGGIGVYWNMIVIPVIPSMEGYLIVAAMIHLEIVDCHSANELIAF